MGAIYGTLRLNTRLRLKVMATLMAYLNNRRGTFNTDHPQRQTQATQASNAPRERLVSDQRPQARTRRARRTPRVSSLRQLQTQATRMANNNNQNPRACLALLLGHYRIPCLSRAELASTVARASPLPTEEWASTPPMLTHTPQHRTLQCHGRCSSISKSTTSYTPARAPTPKREDGLRIHLHMEMVGMVAVAVEVEAVTMIRSQTCSETSSAPKGNRITRGSLKMRPQYIDIKI